VSPHAPDHLPLRGGGDRRALSPPEARSSTGVLRQNLAPRGRLRSALPRSGGATTNHVDNHLTEPHQRDRPGSGWMVVTPSPARPLPGNQPDRSPAQIPHPERSATPG